MTKQFSLLTFFLLATLLLLSACKKDEDETDKAIEKINTWIYKTMNDYYFWTDEMPENINKTIDPTVYFNSLLYKQEDRFSVIVPNYQELINSLSGVTKEAGYEMAFVRRQNGDINGVIQYVKKHSPAHEKGLRRGDIIIKINNQEITENNFRELSRQLSSDHSLTYSRYDEEKEEYINKGVVELNVVIFNENPHHLDTVLVTPGGRQVGYYVYNFFSNGPPGANYDKIMDDIFSLFQSEGIEEMVLDLRYNGGGAVNSAINLASLIGKDVDESKIFYEVKYNEAYTNHIKSLHNGDQLLKRRFRSKSENIGNQLASNRIIVLTGRGTASASELIINGLRPFMQVFLIGRNTVGKNVGSFAIEDKENKENKYGLLPIVSKSYNSLGQSDYGTEEGFKPDIEINEYSFIFKPLGDINEPLLAQALAIIDGSSARIKEPDPELKLIPLMSTLEQKQRFKQLIME